MQTRNVHPQGLFPAAQPGASSQPLPTSHATLWPLRDDVLHLNHGSFGACPTAILEFQRALQDELERDPVEFFVRQLPGRLAAARAALGSFVGACRDDLAFVANATQGVNAVVRSLRFETGDELLTTDHAYGACRKTLDYTAHRARARVVAARVPFPLKHEDQIVEAILSDITPRTRLLMIDHVTSPTALVFPVKRIVDEVQGRGVDVLIDGAHALGMLPLNLDALGAAYYTANAHKWLCAPKGAAFLHVRRDRQHLIHPTTISHGFDPARSDACFREEFDWVGTIDPTPPLCIPECLRYLAKLLPGGWDHVMRRNHERACRARVILCQALGIHEPCPTSMLGSMASIPLPEAAPHSPAATLDHEQLPCWFRAQGAEVAICPWPGPAGKLIRVSAQLYNHEAQYTALIKTIFSSIGRASG